MNKMKVVFLSHQISKDTPLYNGEGEIIIAMDKVLGKHSCNTLRISLPNHTSTHVDVPSHFIKNGLTLTDYSPEEWIFRKVEVVDVEVNGTIITPEMIEVKNDAELVILRTGFETERNSEEYWKNYPGIHPGVAKFLKKKTPSLRALGVDLISISSPLHRELGRKAHFEFLSRNIMLIEDMKLSQLDFKPSLVIVLPLMIKNGDGAPCSIIAID